MHNTLECVVTALRMMFDGFTLLLALGALLAYLAVWGGVRAGATHRSAGLCVRLLGFVVSSPVSGRGVLGERLALRLWGLFWSLYFRRKFRIAARSPDVEARRSAILQLGQSIKPSSRNIRRVRSCVAGRGVPPSVCRAADRATQTLEREAPAYADSRAL